MPYAARADMVSRYSEGELIQLTDRDTLGQINDTVLNQALADAEAEINGYLAAAMALPLASVPLVIKRITCDVARYYLYDDRATEQVARRYKDAVQLLRDIAARKVSLGLDGANQPATVAGGVSYKSGGRIFTGDTLVDY